MMKKLISSLVVLGFVSTPAFADGVYKSKPTCKNNKCKTCNFGCGLWKATKFTLKLPFRIITSTGKGIYDLVVDQDFSGFEEGYELI